MIIHLSKEQGCCIRFSSDDPDAIREFIKHYGKNYVNITLRANQIPLSDYYVTQAALKGRFTKDHNHLLCIDNTVVPNDSLINVEFAGVGSALAFLEQIFCKSGLQNELDALLKKIGAAGYGVLSTGGELKVITV